MYFYIKNNVLDNLLFTSIGNTFLQITHVPLVFFTSGQRQSAESKDTKKFNQLIC